MSVGAREMKGEGREREMKGFLFVSTKKVKSGVRRVRKGGKGREARWIGWDGG